MVEKRKVNPLDSFSPVLKQKIADLMIDPMGQNSEIVSKYINGPDFQNVTFKELAKHIYDEINRGRSE